jgi:hypothetical protein
MGAVSGALTHRSELSGEEVVEIVGQALGVP